jgi:hypothetical protein
LASSPRFSVVNSSAVTSSHQSQNGDNFNAVGRRGNGTPLKDAMGNPIQGLCGYGSPALACDLALGQD